MSHCNVIPEVACKLHNKKHSPARLKVIKKKGQTRKIILTIPVHFNDTFYSVKV